MAANDILQDPLKTNLSAQPLAGAGSLQQGGIVAQTMQAAPSPIQQAPAPQATQAPAQPPAVAQAAPVVRGVTEQETVQGQLQGILAKESPLLQRAQGRAMDIANSRGLLNSAMAAQAGTAAMIDAAAPIAAQDAQTFQSASRENQSTLNQAAQFNTDALNKMGLAGFQAQTSKELAAIEAQYKTAMQASETAKSLYMQVTKNITDIMLNDRVPAAEKQGLVQQQSSLLRSGLAVASADMGADFTRLLDFGGAQGAAAPANAPAPAVVAAPAPAPVAMTGQALQPGVLAPYVEEIGRGA